MSPVAQAHFDRLRESMTAEQWADWCDSRGHGVAEAQAVRNERPAVTTPCGHNAPLQLEVTGTVAANFCPTCRAVEAEREHIAILAAGFCPQSGAYSGAGQEIARLIRNGEWGPYRAPQ